MKTPVRMRGPLAPTRRPMLPTPAVNPFDITTIMQMFTQLTAMHDEVLQVAADLEKKCTEFDDIKQGPEGLPGLPGPAPDHEKIVADVLKKVRVPADGKSPQVQALAGALLPLMVRHFEKNKPKVKDGKPGVDAAPVDTAMLLDKLFEEIQSGKRKLSIGHIEGLDNKFAEVRNAAAMGTEIYGKNTWKRGGGDTVEAGTGVTVVETVNGRKRISVIAAPVGIIAVAGVIDDSNLTFTAASEPVLLNINGAFYQKTGGSYTWTYAAGTITLNAAVGTGGSIFGI